MGFLSNFPFLRLIFSYFPGEAEIRVFFLFFSLAGGQGHNGSLARLQIGVELPRKVF